jgi:hypothetical protein
MVGRWRAKKRSPSPPTPQPRFSSVRGASPFVFAPEGRKFLAVGVSPRSKHHTKPLFVFVSKPRRGDSALRISINPLYREEPNQNTKGPKKKLSGASPLPLLLRSLRAPFRTFAVNAVPSTHRTITTDGLVKITGSLRSCMNAES